ncbi:MAG: hypothetical protein WC764_01320 [Candidatus Paceibacterota bacterium]|jgi:hypothetical protein
MSDGQAGNNTKFDLLVDFTAKLKAGALSEEEVKLFLQRRNPFKLERAGTGPRALGGRARKKLLTPWIAYWGDLYKVKLDLRELAIPVTRPGFGRLIIEAPGVTINRRFDVCAKQFTCWRYTADLDASVTRNDRFGTEKPHAIWVRDGVEADAEWKNCSANDLEDKKVQGISLPERLDLELKYFLETGKHLDSVNITLCSGSRYSGGYVPLVYWYYGKLSVHWYDADGAHEHLRAREVVS